MDVLIGLQWGDEGKGKIVDFLSPEYDVVARFQGGPNAGHTLEFDGIKHVLHQIPSGVFHKKISNIIGNGVVIDPAVLKREFEALAKYSVDPKQNVFISKKAHLIIPTHKLVDKAQELSKGEHKIGSTLRGIGPAYKDKTGRQGLRLGDMLLPDFKARYQKLVDNHLQVLAALGFQEDFAQAEKDFFEGVEYLKGFSLVDGEYFINGKIKEGKKVLAEGAQGSLLDVDFGSYPFVTSSNTVVAGACLGLGVAPKEVQNVFGIVKAYCTRVGGGPFPTELFDEDGKKLQSIGKEVGATTGRIRRCGWLDMPALKYSVMLNGVTEIFLMKTDVLDTFEEIKICTHYQMPDGTVTDELPYDLNDIKVTPVYKTFKGWNQSLESFTRFEDFPKELKDYLDFIEKESGTHIGLVSVGPDRLQTIVKRKKQ